MTGVEGDVRELFAGRVAATPANPVRAVQVHARVERIRRGRTATAAVSLAITVVGCLAIVAALSDVAQVPAAGSAQRHFDGGGRPLPITGFLAADDVVEFTGAKAVSVMAWDFRELLLVTSCSTPGLLRVYTGKGQRVAEVPCETPVDDHHEGTALVSGTEAVRLIGTSPPTPPRPLQLMATTPGQWRFGVLRANLPDRLVPDSGKALLDGPRHPAGGTFTLTVPGSAPDVLSDFAITVECVDGVRLIFRIAGELLADVLCSRARPVDSGQDPAAAVPGPVAARLGLRPGQQVAVTVQSSGRATDQWRVVSVQR